MYKSPSRYNLRNSYDTMLLSYPRVKTKVTLGDCAFVCAAPKLWNVLPIEIRSESSVGYFKSMLKVHINIKILKLSITKL